MPSLFIASLGNPPPKYHKTLHSAGHILLRALAEHLCADSFSPSPYYKSGLTTETYLPRSQTRLTLWQSPTLMNVSGPTLVGAYKSWLVREGAPTILHKPSPVGTTTTGIVTDVTESKKSKKKSKAPADARPPLSLIIVHDELDLPPGQLRIRRGGAELSARGHNGLKSVTTSLVKANLLLPTSSSKPSKPSVTTGEGSEPPVLLRVGIGIGRPASRDPGVVADYVLREMREVQYQETCARAGMLAEMLDGEMMRVQS